MYNPFSLEGKTIFISGASSGIGQSIAIESSKAGACVIISGRNRKRLQETFDALEGKNHIQMIADLENSLEIQNITDNIPSLDGIVHCAGFTKTLPFQFVNEDDLKVIMQVNFMAPALISQALLKMKKVNQGASILFISSISGLLVSFIGNSMYSASKGAINGLIKGMALDLAAKKIRVNAISPGMVETNILDKGLISEEQIKEDLKKYPLKRYGKPVDVAYAAIYLLSDASQWVTGSNLVIDGGYTLL